MPPQTDETLSVNEKILIDQSLSDYTQKVARIEKYLLLLLFIQWVCSNKIFCKDTIHKRKLNLYLTSLYVRFFLVLDCIQFYQ